MREVRSSGAKELERTRIEVFHERNNLAGCSRACGATRVYVPAGEIFMETFNISVFALIIPIFFPAAAKDLHIYLFLFLLSFYVVFDTRNHWRLLYLKILYLEREKASSLSP